MKKCKEKGDVMGIGNDVKLVCTFLDVETMRMEGAKTLHIVLRFVSIHAQRFYVYPLVLSRVILSIAYNYIVMVTECIVH